MTLQPHITSGTLPPFRIKASVTPFENRLFLFGGFDEDDALDSNLYLLDLTTGEWTTRGESVPREGHSTLYHAPSKRMLVFGGVPDEATQRSQLLFYNLQEGQWEAGPALNEPPQRGRHAACLSEDGTKMFISGGLDSLSRPYDELYCFDIGSQTWLSTGPRSFIPRFDHFMTCMGNRIFLFGGLGGDMNHVTSVISWFDLETNTTGEIRMQKLNPQGDHIYVLVNPEVVLDIAIPLSTSDMPSQPCVGSYELSHLRYNVLLLGSFTPLKAHHWRHVFRYEDTLCFLGHPQQATASDPRLSHLIRLALCDLGMAPTPRSAAAEDLSLVGDFARFFKSGEWTDFEITALDDPEPLAVHRAILLARWPHFRRLMASGMAESTTNTLHIPEARVWVQGLLQFLYTNQIDPEHSVEVVSGMLVLSNIYGLDHLRALCLAKIYDYTYAASFTFDNYVQLWERACQADELILKHNLLQAIQLNWGQIVRCSAVARLPHNVLLDLTLQATAPDAVILSASHRPHLRDDLSLAFTRDESMDPGRPESGDPHRFDLGEALVRSPSFSPSLEPLHLTPVQRLDDRLGRASPLSSVSSFLQ